MLRKSAHDVVIIGGGVMGSSIAYYLSSMQKNLKIAVVERDPRYITASAMLSAGGIRQQFSLPENIKMSMYGIELLKNPEILELDGFVPDFQFHETGYLFLATEGKRGQMEKNNETQQTCGVTWVDLMLPSMLSSTFPWLNTSDIALGSYGSKNEGYFDPWAFLTAVKKKAMAQGVTYITGSVADAILSPGDSGPVRINQLSVQSSVPAVEEDSILYPGVVVNACGPWSGALVDMLANKCSSPSSITPLPVRPRKRSVFLFHRPPSNTVAVPPPNTPLTVDPTGVWFRPEGTDGRFICGVCPTEDDDPDCTDSETLRNPDHNLFESTIWPCLYERVPAFGEIKVKSSWAGFYEYNTLDQNAIIGRHSSFDNMFICSGFSGHGLQQAGRAMAELIVNGEFSSLDLSIFSFDRIISNNPVFEEGIV